MLPFSGFLLVLSRGGHAQLFLSPRSQFSNLKEAIPQLFKDLQPATLQFCNRNYFWSPQLQVRNLRTSLPQFSAYFWPWNSVDSWKNWRKKISWICSFKANFWVTDNSKNIFGWFLKPSWAEEKGLESSSTGRRLRRVTELRSLNFKGPQSQFRNFFFVRNYAIDLVIHYCRAEDLNCECPPMVFRRITNTDNKNVMTRTLVTTPTCTSLRRSPCLESLFRWGTPGRNLQPARSKMYVRIHQPTVYLKGQSQVIEMSCKLFGKIET